MPGYDAETMAALYASLKTTEALAYAMDADARTKGISPATRKTLRSAGFSARMQSDTILTQAKGLFGADLYSAPAPAPTPAAPAYTMDAKLANPTPGFKEAIANPSTPAAQSILKTAIKSALKGKAKKAAS